jgi:hypothetical protein
MVNLAAYRSPNMGWNAGADGSIQEAVSTPRFEPKFASQSGLVAETCTNRQLVPLNTARQIIQTRDYPPSTVNARQLTACWRTLFKRLNPYLANSRLQSRLPITTDLPLDNS